MANFQLLRGRFVGLGAQTSFKPAVGVTAVPQRVVTLSPTVEAAPLAAGSQFLSLPQWSQQGGPMTFKVAADLGGSTLTGMGQPSIYDINEYGLLGALVLIICTQGITSTSADDPSAPVTSRFWPLSTSRPDPVSCSWAARSTASSSGFRCPAARAVAVERTT